VKSIKNGSPADYIQWLDTDGNEINASDGGILYAEGAYHWYGMALRPLPFDSGEKGGQTTTIGVVMYRSLDLLNWEYEGVILPCSQDPADPLYGPMRFERPKILHNEKTGQYVLWCHYVKYPGNHGFTHGTAEAGVAVCDTVNGTYKWLGCSRPIDEKGYVRDCTVYKDEDGSAYFIYDRQTGDSWDGADVDRCIHIVKLDETYTGFTGVYRRIEEAYWREAAVLMKQEGTYYMITSGLTSWEFNQARYFRAENLLGPWEDMGDPCIGDEDHLTFHSQGTYIFPVEGKKDCFIFMAERHNTENFLHCSYIWLPVSITPDKRLSLSYTEEWVP
jgi:hypothetical protein